MNNTTTNRSVITTGLVLAIAALLWAAVLVVLLLVVPGYERAFRDQNVSLPTATRWTLAAEHWANHYWYVVPLFGLFILPVIVLLSWLLRHRATGAFPGRAWFGFLVSVPLLVLLAIWLSLLLP
jgi:type II secretory pathway component PulF